MSAAYHMDFWTLIAPLLSLQFLVLPALVGIAYILRRQSGLSWNLSAPAIAAFALLTSLVLPLAMLGYGVIALFLAPLLLFVAAWAFIGSDFAKNHLLLWSVGFIPALLSSSNLLFFDYNLQRISALLSSYILSFLGFMARVDGTTMVGLGVPVYVTDACAGFAVMLGALAASAIVATCFVHRQKTRWLLVLGFMAAYFVGNIVRIVTIGLAVAVSGREAALAIHNPAGYLIAVLLYGGLALSVFMLRKLHGQPAGDIVRDVREIGESA